MFVCLLPARNCADDLPEYFESVARFADAVVALDDGSTDETRAVLDAQPLVQRVLTNPVRADYRGWDDAANRSRLLAAAAELEPDWVISLDADERIDPTDAVAMRAFVHGSASRDDAYLLRVHRMIDGLEYYDDASLWVGRLFPYESGQAFPSERLHFVPLPTTIPRERWRRTTFRIQHLAGATEDRRQQRFAKYQEADPDLELQPGYSHLLTPPGRLVRWWPRPADLPVIANTAFPGPPPAGTRAVSVIVVAPGEPDRIEAAGAAPGRYVLMVDDEDSSPSAESLAACTGAHERGFAMVSGTSANATRTLSGWAAHFLEHSAVLPGAPAGVLDHPPRHCSYLRTALLGVDLAALDHNDAALNAELFDRGYGAYHEPAFVTVARNDCRTMAHLMRHQRDRGRRAAQLGGRSPHHWRRLARITRNVWRWGSPIRRWYVLAFPMVVVGVVSEWLGGRAELRRRRPT